MYSYSGGEIQCQATDCFVMNVARATYVENLTQSVLSRRTFISCLSLSLSLVHFPIHFRSLSALQSFLSFGKLRAIVPFTYPVRTFVSFHSLFLAFAHLLQSYHISFHLTLSLFLGLKKVIPLLSSSALTLS
jgi:hypothetical protein